MALGDVMAMTEHRKADTVLGYYRTGNLSEDGQSVGRRRYVLQHPFGASAQDQWKRVNAMGFPLQGATLGTHILVRAHSR